MNPRYTFFNHYVEDGFLHRTDPSGTNKPAKIDLNNHEAVRYYIVELDNAMWASRHHYNELEKKHDLLVEKIEAALAG